MQQEQIKTNKIIRNIFIGFSVISLLFCVLLFMMWHERARRSKELAVLNATKNKMFSIISHDLKSPIAAQKMAIEAVMKNIDHLDKDAISERFSSFHECAESQLSLVRNLLDWANLQEGKIEHLPIAFNVAEIVEKTASLYNVAAENKKVIVKTDTSCECIAYADKQMIGTVVRNLLNNAVKFSNPESSVLIKVFCVDDKTRVSITDNGIGMSEELINNLFKNGKMSSRQGTQGEKGSGLGLVICKDFLQLNGSQLNIESKKNEGTTISFDLAGV